MSQPAEPSGWNVCIDFGTAFSKAAAAPTTAWENFDPRFVRPLPLAGLNIGRNPFLLTSAIFVGQDRIFFDAAAIGQAGRDRTGGGGAEALRRDALLPRNTA
jgi:hypothetical protein